MYWRTAAIATGVPHTCGTISTAPCLRTRSAIGRPAEAADVARIRLGTVELLGLERTDLSEATAVTERVVTLDESYGTRRPNANGIAPEQHIRYLRVVPVASLEVGHLIPAVDVDATDDVR